MKRISGLLLLAVLLLSSCQTLTKTARIANVSTSLQSATVVDLIPATEQRITHTIEPNKDICRGGMDNVKQAVVNEALVEKGNNADVLLEPQYVVSKKRTLFGSKVTSITVSGRPAYYANFRALDDSVWCNPVFRGVNMHQRSLSLSGMKTPLKKNYDYNESAYRSKGFTMYLTPFVGNGTAELDDGYWAADETDASIGVLLSGGYQLNPYIFIGLGTGLNKDFCVENTYIPLFANARFNLSKKKNTFFADFKLGASYIFETEDRYYMNDILSEQTFAGVSVGYSFGNIDIAYQYFYRSYSFEHENRYDYDYYNVTQNTSGISIGFRF